MSITPDITQKKHEETLKGGEDKPGWPVTLGFKESHRVRSLSFCLMYPRLSVEEADNLEMLMDTHTHAKAQQKIAFSNHRNRKGAT